MNTPKIVNLDLTNCKYLGEMHLRIKDAFDFPDFYGQNWDAFWDLLCGTRDNTIVEIKGLKKLPKELQPSGDMIISILKENISHVKALKESCPHFDCRFDYRVID